MIITANKIIYSKTDFRAKENLKSSPENAKTAANQELPSYELSKYKYINSGVNFASSSTLMKKPPSINAQIKLLKRLTEKLELRKAAILEEKLIKDHFHLVEEEVKKINLEQDDNMQDQIQNGLLGVLNTIRKHNPKTETGEDFIKNARKNIRKEITGKFSTTMDEGDKTLFVKTTEPDIGKEEEEKATMVIIKRLPKTQNDAPKPNMPAASEKLPLLNRNMPAVLGFLN